MFYLTSRDAKTERRELCVSYLYDFRFKCYCSDSGFRVFGDLDLWPMFYFWSHALEIVHWNLYAKFHNNTSGDMLQLKFWKIPYAL